MASNDIPWILGAIGPNQVEKFADQYMHYRRPQDAQPGWSRADDELRQKLHQRVRSLVEQGIITSAALTRHLDGEASASAANPYLNSPYSVPLDQRSYSFVEPQGNPYAAPGAGGMSPSPGGPMGQSMVRPQYVDANRHLQGPPVAADAVPVQGGVAPTGKQDSSSAANAAKASVTRAFTGSSTTAKADAPKPGTPAAHRAAPSWKESILRAASAGDAYNRSLLDLVIRARKQAMDNKAAGNAPFVPIRDYKANMMILVAADGTEFVFDMKDERGATGYLTALGKAGYDPTEISRLADASSRGLAQIATQGAREFTQGAGEVLSPEVMIAEAVKGGLREEDIPALLDKASGIGG